MQFLTHLFTLIVVGLLSISSVFAESIREIVVVDNSKTTDDTVVYIANIERGDEWNETVRARTVVSLQSSGLFRSVEIFSKIHEQGGVKVEIHARDKHSWVVAPTVYNQPTNKGVGLGFGENNLFGENKKLFLYGQVATGDSFLVAAYIDPSIAHTVFHWAFDVFLQNQRVIEYGIPTKFLAAPKAVRQTKMRYLNGGVRVGTTLFRSVSLDARLRGAYVYFGKPTISSGSRPVDVDVGATTADEILSPGKDGWDISNVYSLEFDRRANWLGVTTGDRYAVSYERSLSQLGSDFDYWVANFAYVRARRYFERHNLVLKGSISYGETLPFQAEFTAGGTSLRGYREEQFRGDFMAGFNAEYSAHLLAIPFPLLGRLAVRGHVFADSRYTTFVNANSADGDRHYLPGTMSTYGLAPLKNSVGVGTRFFAQSIVLPLLGLDVGYGLESGACEVYFAIGITDV